MNKTRYPGYSKLLLVIPFIISALMGGMVLLYQKSANAELTSYQLKQEQYLRDFSKGRGLVYRSRNDSSVFVDSPLCTNVVNTLGIMPPSTSDPASDLELTLTNPE